ncbi:MAG: hypothetical protein ACP5NE_02725 [Candidatus Micrarchaeia archaeon]
MYMSRAKTAKSAPVLGKPHKAKGQFAMLEVAVASILLLSFAGIVSAIFLSYSMQEAQPFTFLGFDFFQTAYRNATLSSCACSPSQACIPLLGKISQAYGLSYLKISSGSRSIAYGSEASCLSSYYTCSPFKINSTYRGVCIFACSG